MVNTYIAIVHFYFLKNKKNKKNLFSLLFIIYLILYYYLAILYATIIIYTYIIYIYSSKDAKKNIIFLFNFFFLFYYSYSSLIIISSSLLYFIPILSQHQAKLNQNKLLIVTTSILSYIYPPKLFQPLLFFHRPVFSPCLSPRPKIQNSSMIFYYTLS